jgi:AcrB/AcrD/AcrF family
MLGRVVDFQAIQEPPGLGGWKCLVQGSGRMSVEVLPDQDHFFRVRVVDVEQFLDLLGKIERGFGAAHVDLAPAGQRFGHHEIVGRTRTFVLIVIARRLDRFAGDILPSEYDFTWAGEAREVKLAGNTSAMIFVFGIIFVFLVLAAQYESWSLPFGIIMAVPFVQVDALLVIMLHGIPNDVYFQVGLQTLIALAANSFQDNVFGTNQFQVS